MTDPATLRWVVTGAAGQLGTDLVDLLQRAGADVVGVDRSALDITATDAVDTFVDRTRPDVVVNSAAYTAVDAAETDEARAYAVNADGPRNLAGACARTGATLVHVSTDYVFAGDATTPYDVDAPPAPRSAYGRTKAAGEQAVLSAGARAHVVRTAWVYGAAGQNFVKTMARLAATHETVDVVDDQRGSPTWSADLAAALVALATSPNAQPGLWHCTNAGETTWCGFARAVFEELGLDPQRVRPTTSDAYPRPAPRPAYSVLSSVTWEAARLPPMRPWRDALAAAFAASPDAFRATG